ncbi:MAG: hypothetical protein ACREDG_05215 [Methylocella sp.]
MRLGEFGRSAIEVGVVQSRSTVIDYAEACNSALVFDEEIAILEKVSWFTSRPANERGGTNNLCFVRRVSGCAGLAFAGADFA